MQGDESPTIGTDQQVVEVMLDPWFGLRNVAAPSDLGDGQNELGLTRFQINMLNTRFLGREVIGVWVRRPRVAIPRANIGDSSEIGRDSRFPVGADRIDGRGKGAASSRLGIQNVTDELVSLAIIPEHLRLGPRPPLQHAPLLPVPRAART
jgi:hypothetical protein